MGAGTQQGAANAQEIDAALLAQVRRQWLNQRTLQKLSRRKESDIRAWDVNRRYEGALLDVRWLDMRCVWSFASVYLSAPSVLAWETCV